MWRACGKNIPGGKALKQEITWWIYPLLPLTGSATAAKDQSLFPEQLHSSIWAQLVPLPHLSLSLIYPPPPLSVNISGPYFFPKGFVPEASLGLEMILLLLVPTWYLQLWCLSYNSVIYVCKLREGKQYVLFSLMGLCLVKSQFGHSLLLWQGYNQIVPDQKPQ